MMLDWVWILLALPAVFTLGWFFSKLDIWHWRLEARHAPRAYFKGLNHLLNGQQDHAVDSFIEAVQNDPDTSELHFTLGNLFRKRGEYDRAVRVHEHLLSRADLSQADRDRAQFALAQDYFRAGLLDRAEAALTSSGSTSNLNTREALTLLLSIYERGRDWDNAGIVAEKLQTIGAGHFERRRAHYLCEQKSFDAAIALSPESPRAYQLLAKEKMNAGQTAQAFELLQTAITHAPQAAPLLALQWMHCATLDSERSIATAQLQTVYAATRSIDVLQTLIESGALEAQAAYTQHLAQTPSLLAAQHLVTAPEVQSTLAKATEPLSRYRCAACGFEAKQYFWQCPGCQAWDSYPFKRVEEL
jgi:lipopolysaccharide assembly protein B